MVRKKPVWEGIIDFGEDWQDIENQEYPIEIEVQDFANNVKFRV